MKTRFIVNLRSGRAARALAEVERHAASFGATLVLTERARHASQLARAALDEGCELIVAVGGDGTMNETASVLVDTPAILGLVPCGSGDGLGRHLGLHGPVARALRILRAGRPRLIDTGLANGNPFFTVAGVGFEAEIAHRFNQLERRGFWRYLTTSMSALRQWRPEEYRISHAGRHESVRAFTLAVANCNQYGNEARIAPAARIDDGLLDLAAVPPLTWPNALPLAWRLFRGTLPRASGVVLRRAEAFVVERAAPGRLHTDGEAGPTAARIEFTVKPASLRVMCPR